VYHLKIRPEIESCVTLLDRVVVIDERDGMLKEEVVAF
jgi:hypothetical protein